MKRNRKLLSFLLACMLLFGSLVTGFAAGNGEKVQRTEVDRAFSNTVEPSGYSSTANWDGIREALRTLLYTSATEVNVSSYAIPFNDANFAYIQNILNYEPEFLHMAEGFEFYGTTYYSTFKRAAKDSAENLKKYHACRDALTQIMYGIKDNASLTTVEKLLALHDRLAAWADYDWDNYLLYNNGYIDDVPDDDYSPYGALVLRKSVCQGYAFAYAWMMDEMGIENYIINSEQLGHAFNQVVLGGKAYYIDVTSDDPIERVPGFVSHKYFLLSYNTIGSYYKTSRGKKPTDIPTNATATDYESQYWTEVGFFSQILTINGNKYYEKPSNGQLYKNGSAVSGIDMDAAYENKNYMQYSPSKMIAIGNEILYTQPKSVRAYNVVTGVDRVVYTPENSFYYYDNEYLLGIDQIDGVVRVYAAQKPGDFTSTAKKRYKSFTFCTHGNCVAITNDAGQSKQLCKDCLAIIDPPKATPLKAANLKLSIKTTSYDGTAKTPTLTVTNDQGKKLSLNTDYTYTTPSGRKNAATYTYTVTGQGKYTGSASVSFTINRQKLSSDKITLSAESAVYNGSVQAPTVTVKDNQNKLLTKGQDYTVTYSPATVKDVGNYTVTVKGAGNYDFSCDKTFSITSTAATETLQAGNVTLSTSSVTYNGKERSPSITVKNGKGDKLTEGTHYTVKRPTTVKNVNTYTYEITGRGAYSGEVTKQFKITAQALAAKNVTLSPASATYTGKQQNPVVTVKNSEGATLISGTDYKVTVPAGRTAAGTYTYTVTGSGNYSGTVTKTFTISEAEALQAENVTFSSPTVTYNGYQRTPTIIVKNNKGTKLTQGTDYTVTVPAGRTNAGDYVYKVKGKGKYTGTVSKTFRIDPIELTGANVTLSTTVVIYNGAPRTPSVTVKSGGKTLTSGTDYTLTVPAGRTNAGIYSYVVKGKGNYGGVAEKVFVIERQQLHAENVSLSADTVTANGSVRNPTVTVKNAAGKVLTAGKDYEVIVPDGRKNPGSYTYTINGLGNYSWTIKKIFTIK